MIGNPFGLLLVRCRHKENVPPDGMLAAEKFEQGSVIRE
jgi:hypothetical protein